MDLWLTLLFCHCFRFVGHFQGYNPSGFDDTMMAVLNQHCWWWSVITRSTAFASQAIPRGNDDDNNDDGDDDDGEDDNDDDLPLLLVLLCNSQRYNPPPCPLISPLANTQQQTLSGFYILYFYILGKYIRCCIICVFFICCHSLTDICESFMKSSS